MKTGMRVLAMLGTLMSFGCRSVPKGISTVDGFEVKRYLGTWHEIARFDNWFERGLTRVTATYSLREDGGVRVLNKGFDAATGKWKQAEGKAYFRGKPSKGELKVSFFGPFYGAYNIVELDKADYSHAIVCGPDRSYLWILAREKALTDVLLKSLVDKAASLGFSTNDLLYVSQEGN
jgi:apolipoprotein D and lipocalin family protein